MEETETKLIEFFESKLATAQPVSITADKDLLTNEILDSLSMLQLVIFIEEEFRVTVPDHEVLPENFRTVANIAHFIQRRLAPQQRQKV